MLGDRGRQAPSLHHPAMIRLVSPARRPGCPPEPRRDGVPARAHPPTTTSPPAGSHPRLLVVDADGDRHVDQPPIAPPRDGPRRAARLRRVAAVVPTYVRVQARRACPQGTCRGSGGRTRFPCEAPASTSPEVSLNQCPDGVAGRLRDSSEEPARQDGVGSVPQPTQAPQPGLFPDSFTRGSGAWASPAVVVPAGRLDALAEERGHLLQIRLPEPLLAELPPCAAALHSGPCEVCPLRFDLE